MATRRSDNLQGEKSRALYRHRTPGERKRTDRLIRRRIDHVSQHLFSILDRSSFRIAIAQKNQFVLLRSPKASNAFFGDFDDAKGQMSSVQHDDSILIDALYQRTSRSLSNQCEEETLSETNFTAKLTAMVCWKESHFAIRATLHA